MVASKLQNDLRTLTLDDPEVRVGLLLTLSLTFWKRDLSLARLFAIRYTSAKDFLVSCNSRGDPREDYENASTFGMNDQFDFFNSLSKCAIANSETHTKKNLGIAAKCKDNSTEALSWRQSEAHTSS